MKSICQTGPKTTPIFSHASRLSPRKTLCWKASQKVLNNPPLTSLSPTARKLLYWSKVNFQIIVKFLISSRFAWCLKLKLFYSRWQNWGFILLKHTKRETQSTLCFSSFGEHPFGHLHRKVFNYIKHRKCKSNCLKQPMEHSSVKNYTIK